MRKTTLIATASTLALALGLGTAALASSDKDRDDSRARSAAPMAEWMSVATLSAKIEAEGYRVREIEADDGLYEVEALDPAGKRVEAKYNPVTGERVRGWKEDD